METLPSDDSLNQPDNEDVAENYLFAETQSILSRNVNFIHIIKLIFDYVILISQRFLEEVHGIEMLFITMSSAYTFMCQMFFLTMCDLALLSHEEKLIPDTNQTRVIANSSVPIPTAGNSIPITQQYYKNDVKMINGLSTLLLYTVFSYFVSKVRDICQSSQIHTVRTRNHTRDLVRWSFRILLEWIKVIVIILCLREQGMQYEPQLVYTLVTAFYYLFTEKIFTEIFVSIIRSCNIQHLESLEHLYVPIVLNSFAILASTILVGHLLKGEHCGYALIATYFTVYLRLKDLICNALLPLQLELRTYASFRVATDADLHNWNDICAVCLNTMSRARITPCNHLFHPYCLKRCLQSSFQCPLCKQNFLHNT